MNPVRLVIFIFTIFTTVSRAIAQGAGATPASDITVPPGFKIELLRSAQSGEGSWVSMAVDDKGRLYISPQGKEKLVRVTLRADGRIEKWEPLAVPVTSAMGMLWAFDSLYVSGLGPEGQAIYRLRDTNADDQLDKVQLFKKVSGGAGEHGAHALILGPDNKLYIAHGNATPLIEGTTATSPYRNYQEDSLLSRILDPVATFFDKLKVPYGHVLRTGAEGKEWEIFAAGFRNHYDIDFNEDGELFTYDSDMEWDVGLPWYRPTRILHVTSGADFGFREGSTKWPDYYPDSLPAVANVGLGSPTGIKFGTKSNFPGEYRKALFAMDWTYGRILAVHLQPKGASYGATFEDFVKGKGLPVTDLEFGKDGAMYFTVGGRGTQGGLYRVSVDTSKAVGSQSAETFRTADSFELSIGAIPLEADPAEFNKLYTIGGDGFVNVPYAGRVRAEGLTLSQLEKAIQTRLIEKKIFRWPTITINVPEKARLITVGGTVRAPQRIFWSADMTLVSAPNAAGGQPRAPIRATKPTSPLEDRAATEQLRALRHQLEEFHRREDPRAVDFAWPHMGHGDRYIRYAARLAIERQPVAQWKDRALAETNPQSALNALLALARVGEKSVQEPLLKTLAKFPLDSLAEPLKLDELRVIEVSFIRQGRPSEELVKAAIETLSRQFPTKDYPLNHELSQLLVWLEAPDAIEKTLRVLETSEAPDEQIWFAYVLREAKGWKPEQEKRYFAWFAKARAYKGGNSFPKFIDRIKEQALAKLSDVERAAVAALLEPARPAKPAPPVAVRPFVKAWTMSDLARNLDKVGSGRNFARGKELFAAVQCLQCHKFGNEGGTVGPDLTAVASRFKRSDLLEAIIDPSKALSEQYASFIFTLKNGDLVTGQIAEENNDHVDVITDPIAGTKQTVGRTSIENRRISPVSLMPPGLLNSLTEDEILDLLAYIETAGVAVPRNSVQ